MYGRRPYSVLLKKDMKRSSKTALGAIIAALATALMLVSYFPYFTYAVPAVCGLFMMIPLIETGVAWALGSYAVSAALSLVLAEPESALLYAFLFGYYPVLKAVIERLHNAVLEWIIKLVVFNLAAAAAMFIFVKVFSGLGISETFADFKYGAVTFIVLCEIAFVLYDIAISRVSVFYMTRLHPRIKKLIK